MRNDGGCSAQAPVAGLTLVCLQVCSEEAGQAALQAVKQKLVEAGKTEDQASEQLAPEVRILGIV